MLTNPYIIVPLAVWAISQLMKFVVATFRGTLDFRLLYASGGMPSVHSAVVCSLAVTALILDGPQSHLFGLTVILAGIVMYDSFGVRRASGEQAAALNMLIVSLGEGKVRLSQPGLKLREVLGHKPSEVAVGAVVGSLLAALFNVSRLEPQLEWLKAVPAGTELLAYTIIFAALVAGGVLTRVLLPRFYRGSQAMLRLAKAIFIKTQVLGWLGAALVFAQYESLSYLAWRAWPIVLLIALAAWDGWLLANHAKALPGALAEEQESARKRKWFEIGKKKKK